MTIITGILLLVGTFLGGLITSFVFLHLLVPFFVRKVGEEKFVEMRALGGLGLPIQGGIVSAMAFILLPVFLTHRYHKVPHLFPAILLTFPSIALLLAAYAVAWLWLHGIGNRKREFHVCDGGVRRMRDGIALTPVFVVQDGDYVQTDAYSGYSLYQLTLHDDNGALASNHYLSEKEKDEELRRLAEFVSSCRTMDLVFAWRETPTRWLQVHLSPRWTPLLCGVLQNLSAESQAWWRRWLGPQFLPDQPGTTSAEEIRTRLEELHQAYSGTFSEDRLLQNQYEELIELTGRASGPIEVMSCGSLLAVAREAASNGGTLMYHQDGDGYDRLLLSVI